MRYTIQETRACDVFRYASDDYHPQVFTLHGDLYANFSRRCECHTWRARLHVSPPFPAYSVTAIYDPLIQKWSFIDRTTIDTNVHFDRRSLIDALVPLTHKLTDYTEPKQ